MSYRLLKIEKLEGVAMLTMQHPDDLNALSVEMSKELKQALSELSSDTDTRAVLIKGEGRAFSSGGNLKEMKQGLTTGPGEYMDELTSEVYEAIEKLMDFEKPVVAEVHGFAYGAAFNLVLACDLSVASEETVFCESFTRLGLIPGGLATVLLTRTAGYKRALEICLTAREIPAEEALALGFVNAVTPGPELHQKAMELTKKLAEAPPLAVRETKRLLKSALTLSGAEQSRLERETQVKMAETKDFAEGVSSFFEKRRPRFKGE